MNIYFSENINDQQEREKILSESIIRVLQISKSKNGIRCDFLVRTFEDDTLALFDCTQNAFGTIEIHEKALDKPKFLDSVIAHEFCHYLIYSNGGYEAEQWKSNHGPEFFALRLVIAFRFLARQHDDIDRVRMYDQRDFLFVENHPQIYEWCYRNARIFAKSSMNIEEIAKKICRGYQDWKHKQERKQALRKLATSIFG